MSGIGVVVNPHSKQYKDNPEKMKRLGFIVGDRGDFASTQDLRDIRVVAERFKERHIDILALGGGDGTNHRTLTTFIQIYGDKPLPKIAMLRGGTLNTVAFSCGVRGSPEKNLSNLLFKYHEDEEFETAQVTMMQINDYYGFIWGCGVIYRFMENYYALGQGSPLNAAWTLARAIGSAVVNGPFACKMFERMSGEVAVNETKWPFKNYSAIYAGSVEYLGLNFRVFYHARDPERFHAVGFSLPPRNVLPYVPMMFLGRPSGCPNLIEAAAEEMIVQLERPQPYTIDGDMHEPADRFVIKTGPRLTVIVR